MFVDGDMASGLGLQRLWGKLRAVLTRDVTNDYDMVNAHPTIALALCNQLFPDETWYKPLAKYVANRDALITQLHECSVPKLHGDEVLAHCRGATWLVGDTTIVALASDRAANAHLQNRLYGL
eukprot:COSAG06_NODE_3207_length_5679_cov_3.005375_3_plen_123_part_00